MSRFSGSLADVDIRLLRVFTMVAEHGGLSMAADSIGVDRSTISRQLTELETRLGVTLCKRGRSGFWLTDDGRTVLFLATELLNSIRDFQRQIHQLHDDMRGELAVCMADMALSHPHFRLPEAISDMAASAPHVHISLEILPPDEIERAILHRRCHIGLTATANRRLGLSYRYLFAERNRLYAANDHPVFAIEGRRLEHIASYPIATVRYGSGMSAQIQRLQLARGAVTNSTEGIAALVLSGGFLGFLPTHYAEKYVTSGQLRPVDIENTDYDVDICIVSLENEQKLAVSELFMRHIERRCLSG